LLQFIATKEFLPSSIILANVSEHRAFEAASTIEGAEGADKCVKT